jgi:hypothetical protein
VRSCHSSGTSQASAWKPMKVEGIWSLFSRNPHWRKMNVWVTKMWNNAAHNRKVQAKGNRIVEMLNFLSCCHTIFRSRHFKLNWVHIHHMTIKEEVVNGCQSQRSSLLKIWSQFIWTTKLYHVKDTAIKWSGLDICALQRAWVYHFPSDALKRASCQRRLVLCFGKHQLVVKNVNPSESVSHTEVAGWKGWSYVTEPKGRKCTWRL